MVLVVLLLAAVATVAVPLVVGAGERARRQATALSLMELRRAIVGAGQQPGYLQDCGKLPWPGAGEGRADYPQLRYLIDQPADVATFDPVTRVGWRGPYIAPPAGRYAVDGTFTATYGVAGDPAVLDGWGQPIVLQLYEAGATAAERSHRARLVSAGPDGVLNADPTAANASELVTLGVGDDLVLFLHVADAVNLDPNQPDGAQP